MRPTVSHMRSRIFLLPFTALVFAFGALLLVTEDVKIELVLHAHWAAWVQAIGTLLALLIAIWIPNHIHTKDIRTRIEREDRDIENQRKRILSALYIEIFGFAARCARDTDTWHKEAMLEDRRGKGDRSVGKRRSLRDMLKFEPNIPVAYPTLAGNLGILEPDVQAAISEFYYRLEAVARDVRRFSRDTNLDGELGGADARHLAQVLFDTCEPAQKALNGLRQSLEGFLSLDEKMNQTYENIFLEPVNLGSTIDEVLEQVLKNGKSIKPS